MKTEQNKKDLIQCKPFPEGYKIPAGVEVIVIYDDRDKHDVNYRKPGLEGITTERSSIPLCNWKDGMTQICMWSCQLAPINLKDHPDYKFDEPETNPEQSKLEQIAEICKQFSAEGVFVELILKKLI